MGTVTVMKRLYRQATPQTIELPVMDAQNPGAKLD
jgi:hypothetical protein